MRKSVENLAVAIDDLYIEMVDGTNGNLPKKWENHPLNKVGIPIAEGESDTSMYRDIFELGKKAGKGDSLILVETGDIVWFLVVS